MKMLERETGLPWWSPAGDMKRLPYLIKLLEKRDILVYNGEGEESEELVRVKELLASLCRT